MRHRLEIYPDSHLIHPYWLQIHINRSQAHESQASGISLQILAIALPSFLFIGTE
jgi:hypothetical protein